MEPKILLIGKNLSSLEILKEELMKFNRGIRIANSDQMILNSIENDSIDIAILGAGLADETLSAMETLIKQKSTDIGIHIMEKKPGMNPTSMIGYTNEKAVMWKLVRAMKPGK